MDDFVIYPSKWKLLLLALASLGFVVLGIFLPDMTTSLRVILIGTYVGVPFFGFCFLYAIYRLILPRPSVVITDVGLVDNASAVGAGLIKWDEISEIYIHEFRGQRFIGIVPRDAEAIIARQSAVKRLMARMNARLVGSAFNIPQSTLPVKVDEVFDRMTERMTR